MSRLRGWERKKGGWNFRKTRKKNSVLFFVCADLFPSHSTRSLQSLAAVAGCMREQNRNYVDCEKTKNGIGANIREIKFNYKLKIVGNQKDGKGKQHTWKEEKRFRAPQWDLCEMMGMRWRKILLSDSIARRRAAAITDNVRKKKEMVKNDICDVTLALRRVESCTALPNLHPDEIELVPSELTHHPLELCVEKYTHKVSSAWVIFKDYLYCTAR